MEPNEFTERTVLSLKYVSNLELNCSFFIFLQSKLGCKDGSIVKAEQNGHDKKQEEVSQLPEEEGKVHVYVSSFHSQRTDKGFQGFCDMMAFSSSYFPLIFDNLNKSSLCALTISPLRYLFPEIGVLIVDPFSISLALAMLYFGAEGRTREELKV